MNDNPRESTHPGPYVRAHVLPPGLTVTEAARRMGVGRPALSNFLNGKAALSPAMAVRLERTFGADRDALLDLQTRFDAREAPAGCRTITAATYAPSVLTIKAREIGDWAGRIESRQELGALVRRLVNSTGRNLSKVDFPAHDNAERRGWDGMVVASAPTPWIPEGESGWELSCNARPRDKANRDFARRTKSVPPRERKACTFAFLTPRDWPGKTAWANEQRRLGFWKDVRAYDASDLEQWIEQSVPVQIWFAERLGRPVAGYRSLSGFWTEWASAVEHHSGRFREWLANSPDRPFRALAKINWLFW
ncbi:MAG: HigA family addiction module antitoxin [Bryobacterales bacterium]|nr:HigA family addiction module antitoxin [Bryobacterales bacterium]